MSEVVKKLVTELGFILKDQDKLKKYSDTAKTLVKTQKESEKVQKQSNATTQKGLTLKEKEKQAIKQETTLKKQTLIEEGKIKTKLINEETKVRLAQIRGVSTTKKKTLTDEEKAIKKQNDKEKWIQENRTNRIKAQQKFKSQIADKEVKQKKLEQEQYKKDFNATQKRIEQNQTILEQKKQESNALLRTQLIAGSLYNQAAKEQQKQKLRNDIEARNQAKIDNQQARLVLNGRVGANGKFNAPIAPPTPKPPPTPKQLTPEQIKKQREQRLEFVNQTLSSGAITMGGKIKDTATDIILGSVDKMLDYGDILNNIQVRGKIAEKDLRSYDNFINRVANQWGMSPSDVASSTLEFTKTGVKGQSLKNLTEQGVIMGKAIDSDTATAGSLLNAFLHQQGANLQTPEAIKNKIGVTNDPKAIDRAVNLLSAAVNESSLNPQDLMYTLKYASTIGAEAGVSPESLLKIAARGANRYMKGSTTGTGTRSIMATMATDINDTFVTGKGKKKNSTERAYTLKDIGINKADVVDKNGNLDVLKAFTLSETFLELNSKKFDKTKRMAIMNDIFGKNAMTLATMLSAGTSQEDKALEKAIDNAVKDRVAQKIAEQRNKSAKSGVARVTSKKETAMNLLGRQFEPETKFISSGLEGALGLFNKDEKMQKAGKSASILAALTGGGLGLAGGAGLIFGGAVGLPLLAATGAATVAFTAFHDVMASMNGDATIIGSIGRSISAFFTASQADMIRQNAEAMRGIGNALREATAGIQEFLPSYQTLAKLGIVEVGVKVTNSGVPYIPGQAPAPRNYVETASANKSTAKKVN